MPPLMPLPDAMSARVSREISGGKADRRSNLAGNETSPMAFVLQSSRSPFFHPFYVSVSTGVEGRERGVETPFLFAFFLSCGVSATALRPSVGNGCESNGQGSKAAYSRCKCRFAKRIACARWLAPRVDAWWLAPRVDAWWLDGSRVTDSSIFAHEDMQ